MLRVQFAPSFFLPLLRLLDAPNLKTCLPLTMRACAVCLQCGPLCHASRTDGPLNRGLKALAYAVQQEKHRQVECASRQSNCVSTAIPCTCSSFASLYHLDGDPVRPPSPPLHRHPSSDPAKCSILPPTERERQQPEPLVQKQNSIFSS